ncbi:MAG: hypothetical protein IPK53_17510 [bacterium]|nr:hypothetical protein [bacterium]
MTTNQEYSGSVRLSNCYVAFNGDTLPEIKVYANSTIDVSDYAGNIVKDSTGMLFECAEVNDFDAELGSNSFVLADTTGKYFNVTSMSGPAYITGNSFYPESVNDSTFIDDFMKQDSVSKWVYSYLRAEDQMDDVIEDPNGSIDFELKAYVQNYLGSVTNDTITQVGFKYRLFPDSTNWTTFRQNTIETDSIYDWTVSVGDQGGLISYIWWAKDRHGRYITSPAGLILRLRIAEPRTSCHLKLRTLYRRRQRDHLGSDDAHAQHQRGLLGQTCRETMAGRIGPYGHHGGRRCNNGYRKLWTG